MAGKRPITGPCARGGGHESADGRLTYFPQNSSGAHPSLGGGGKVTPAGFPLAAGHAPFRHNPGCGRMDPGSRVAALGRVLCILHNSQASVAPAVTEEGQNSCGAARCRRDT